jgi:chromosome segregation ATPase
VAEREKRRLSEQKLVGLSKDFQSARTAEASARASLDAQNSNLGALDTSLKEERQRRSVLEAELKTRAQALDAAQKVEKEARAQASQATGQLQKLQESLRAEQHKTSALKDQLSAQLGGNSVAEATVKKLSDEIERLRAESIAVKKVREELPTPIARRWRRRRSSRRRSGRRSRWPPGCTSWNRALRPPRPGRVPTRWRSSRPTWLH